MADAANNSESKRVILRVGGCVYLVRVVGRRVVCRMILSVGQAAVVMVSGDGERDACYEVKAEFG